MTRKPLVHQHLNSVSEIIFLKEINTSIYNFSQLPHRLNKLGLMLQLRILKFTTQKCPQEGKVGETFEKAHFFHIHTDPKKTIFKKTFSKIFQKHLKVL